MSGGSLTTEQAEDKIRATNSTNRISALIDILLHAPKEVGLSIFVENYSTCDNTWHYRNDILILLKRLGHARDAMDSEALHYFSALPDPVVIYRGCQETRIRGLSWTTERAVAEGFARGHRSMTVAKPVVASAEIPKAAVFFAVTHREEAELVINPRRLRKLKQERYVQEHPDSSRATGAPFK
ncbi:hypothetical protein HJC04_13235 [Rhizobium sp. NLR8a]|uniref:hypothetical protein n=1 Tax=Rhizobium sp. NLR8a TaxID=2731119 RepID=UPI001C83A064|nr:hypothetical protein [Rhizobium sp. NLR8a]MBX5221272.1 hypothetical protein [Rhizobium sp. NLR8a]